MVAGEAQTTLGEALEHEEHARCLHRQRSLQLSDHFGIIMVDHPSDVLKEGQEVKVKLLGFDDRGKVRLAMKMVDQETGEEIVEEKSNDEE